MSAFRRLFVYWVLAAAGLSNPCLAQAPPGPAGREVVDGKIATFSIVAVDPETGVCGAAVASKYPAVGEVVPYVEGGMGAFCTQHFHNPDFGPKALEMLGQDKPPGEILCELVRDDPRAGTRQLALIDRHGRTAQWNPTDAPQRSRWWGAMSGRYYACQGNTLAGRQVIAAMAAAYEETAGSLADRLMAALAAGDRAGGDHRGRLAAGIVVDKPDTAGTWLDLQVDGSDDAVTELARKYAALDHEAKGERPQDPMEKPKGEGAGREVGLREGEPRSSPNPR